MEQSNNTTLTPEEKAKEILLSVIPKDCWWAEMENLCNTPVKYVIDAMIKFASSPQESGLSEEEELSKEWERLEKEERENPSSTPLNYTIDLSKPLTEEQLQKEIAVIIEQNNNPNATKKIIELFRKHSVTPVLSEEGISILIDAAKDFVQKVDDGRARSKDSYAKFKNALAALKQHTEKSDI